MHPYYALQEKMCTQPFYLVSPVGHPLKSSTLFKTVLQTGLSTRRSTRQVHRGQGETGEQQPVN